MHYVSKMMRVRNADEDTQRRGINIVLIAIGLQIIALLLAILSAVAGTISIRSLIFIITSILVQTAVIVLALRGFVDLSGGILVSMATIGITTSAFFNPDEYAIPIFLLIPILIATAVFRPVGIVVTLIGVLAGMGSISIMPLAEELNTQRTTILVTVGLMALFMAGVGVLISKSNLYILRRLHIEVKRVEQANASIQTLNEELDRRVQMQTAALQRIVEDLEQQTQYQNQLLKEIAEQREVIRELSLPLLPIGREVLVAPLIGALDQERMQQLQSHVLKRVERMHARLLILDVTGVPLIDSQVAQGLINLSQGLRLLGANVALVGVRPEVAQTIVTLGVRLQDVEVFSDLGSALQRVVRTMAR